MGRRTRLQLAAVLGLCAVALAAAGTARSGAVIGGEGCAATQLPAGDDTVSDGVPLPFAPKLYGTSYDSAYVWTNGTIGFAPGPYDVGVYPYLLPGAASVEGSPLVAPFYADADASDAAAVTYGTTTYHGRTAFCVEWGGPQGGLGPCCPASGDGNVFEALLVDRSDRGAGDFDAIFDYDRIAWDTGTYDGAIPAQAGIAGGGSSFALFGPAGWALQTLVSGSHGSDVPGRWVFPVVGGQPREPGFGMSTSPAVPTEAQPRTVRLADVNGDGKLDLLVVQTYARWFDVHLGDGHGGFGPSVFQTRVADSAQIAVGDVDGDGKLDVVAAGSRENAPNEPTLLLLRGDGTGDFARTELPSTAGHVGGVGLVDTNGDGRLDIVIARSYPDFQAVVLLGDGHGGFGPQTGTSFSAFSYNGAAVADVTGDGVPDLVAASPEDGGFAVLPGDGHGGWGAARGYAIGVPGSSGGVDGLAVGDVNGDGRTDVALALGSATTGAAVFLQQADGTLAGPRFGGVGSGASPGGIAVADVNGDGFGDLVTGSVGAETLTVVPSLGGFLGPGITYPTSDTVTSVAAGDLDGDGKVDVVNGGPGNTVGVLLNRSDTTPPALTVPADQQVSATSADGAVVTFAATASEGTATCLPASGSRFPVGTTTVWCSAVDAAANTTERSFRVTVTADSKPPRLTVPGRTVVDATSPKGAKVTYAATATDEVDGAVTPRCTPASGSTFAIGDTKVTCTATDAAGNVATASFTVHVQGAPEQLADLLETIVQKKLGPGFSLPAKTRAIVELVAGRLPKLACLPLVALDHELKAQSGKKVPAADAAELRADIARIADVIGC